MMANFTLKREKQNISLDRRDLQSQGSNTYQYPLGRKWDLCQRLKAASLPRLKNLRDRRKQRNHGELVGKEALVTDRSNCISKSVEVSRKVPSFILTMFKVKFTLSICFYGSLFKKNHLKKFDFQFPESVK